MENLINENQEVKLELKKDNKIYAIAKLAALVVRELLICYTAKSLGWQGAFFDPNERASQELWSKSQLER